MKSYSNLVHETNAILHIRGMVEVYEELAAMHMSAIRAEIVQNREFFERLEELALEVGSDTEIYNASLSRRQTALLITANEGLYGDIIERTFQLFLSFIATNETDIFVVGKIGADLMHEYAPNKAYTALSLSDTAIDEPSFANAVKLLLPYQTVHVFYGKFNSIATQKIVMSRLTGETINADTPQTRSKKRLMYLYEPSLSSVSTLFGTEIKTSVFNQILKESQLAKHASRMMHLDGAIERMDEELVNLTKQKRQSLKKIAERKQQARISGLFARGGGP